MKANKTRDVEDAVEWAQQQWPNAVVLEVEATA